MKKVFSVEKDILLDEGNAQTLSSMVDDPKAVADADGQKYIPAGTLLTSDKDFKLTDDGSAVLTPTTDATKAQGLLRHDTNVVEGAQPASVITAGMVNRHMMADSVAQLYTDDLLTALRGVLPQITVVDRI